MNKIEKILPSSEVVKSPMVKVCVLDLVQLEDDLEVVLYF